MVNWAGISVVYSILSKLKKVETFSDKQSMRINSISIIFIVLLFLTFSKSGLTGPGTDLARQGIRLGSFALWNNGIRPTLRYSSSSVPRQQGFNASLVPYRMRERGLVVQPHLISHEGQGHFMSSSKQSFSEFLKEKFKDMRVPTIGGIQRAVRESVRKRGKQLLEDVYQRGAKLVIDKKTSPVKKTLSCDPVRSGFKGILGLISDVGEVSRFTEPEKNAREVTIYFENENDYRYLKLYNDLQSPGTSIYLDEKDLESLTSVDKTHGKIVIRVEITTFEDSRKNSILRGGKIEIWVNKINKIQYVRVLKETAEGKKFKFKARLIETIYPEENL